MAEPIDVRKEARELLQEIVNAQVRAHECCAPGGVHCVALVRRLADLLARDRRAMVELLRAEAVRQDAADPGAAIILRVAASMLEAAAKEMENAD